MQLNGNLEKFLKHQIKHWVRKNFGIQEMEDPSWDIEALSEYLTKKLYKEYGTELKRYELTVLLDPEGDNEKALEKIKRYIEDNKGAVLNIENDGKKRLAYPINGKEFATYCFMDIGLQSTGDASIISAWLNINSDVLRYLMVIKDTRRR